MSPAHNVTCSRCWILKDGESGNICNMLSHSIHLSYMHLKDENSYNKILNFLPFFICLSFMLFFSSYISLSLSVILSHGFYIQFFFPSTPSIFSSSLFRSSSYPFFSFLSPRSTQVLYISHCYSHLPWATINIHRTDLAARPTSVTEVLCLREPPTTNHMAAWWRWAHASRLCPGQLPGFCKQCHQPHEHLECPCTAWWPIHLCCQECPWCCPTLCHAQYLW